MTKLRVKTADQPWEFDEIFRLNHQTFAEEIPQHEARSDGMLRDRFHDENLYLICLDDRTLAGMVALRDRRPFSVDEKVPEWERQVPAHQRPLEVRLLSVALAYRQSRAFALLMQALLRHCWDGGYDMALISGRPGNLELYQRFGFHAFGDMVGKPGAYYQPMYITRAGFNTRLNVFSRRNA